MQLSKMKTGNAGKVRKIEGNRAIRQRLMAMGLTPGVDIKVSKVAPMGDPIELTVRGYKLTLRKTEASCVDVETGDEAK